MPLQTAALLLGSLCFAGVYVLPALFAFLRAHRRFYFILALNLAAAPVQGLLFHALMPGLFATAGAAPLAILGRSLLVLLGPGWAAALVWSLAPAGPPDARLVAARRTKTFDFVAALPLIVWFGYGVLQLRPLLTLEARMILAGEASLFVCVQFFALSASSLFNLVTIWLLVVRDKPVLKSKGWLPRVCGFLGTFLGVGILHLPVAQLGLPMLIVSALLVGTGSLASALVLARLGKAFSIMPEARVLVTSGPYAWARHPLYAVELVTVIGSAMQFRQPWALLLAAAVMALQVIRSVFEERVLSEAYPEYAAYKARTARFVPGII